jgi:hypothetical protein
MLNLFKKQWLPDYIREYIIKKFPEKYFKVTFEIDGKDVPMAQVVGNERRIRRGTVTYTDPERNTSSQGLFLLRNEISFNSVNHAESEFALEGIEPTIRKAPLVGREDRVKKLRQELAEKISKAIDYCPGSFLDRTKEYPVTDIPRWRRKRLLNLLANLSEDSIPVFVSFDIRHASMSQLEQFNEELDLAMMVENKYDPELDEEDAHV